MSRSFFVDSLIQQQQQQRPNSRAFDLLPRICPDGPDSSYLLFAAAAAAAAANPQGFYYPGAPHPFAPLPATAGSPWAVQHTPSPSFRSV